MPTLAQFTPDINTKLKDAGLVAASAAWQVSSSDQIIDLGGAAEVGRMLMDLHMEVTAVEVASGDEIYTVHFQVSSSATFASVIHSTFIAEFGDAAALTGTQDTDSGTGHFVFPVTNDFGGTLYRYCRGYTVTGGTIATGINFDAWLAARH